MGKRPFAIALVLFAVMLAFSGAAHAQGTTSRVTGTVTDGAGAPVPGATVTLTNDGTGVSLTTTTSNEGNYVFDLIQAGSYTVAVEKQGFKRLVSARNTVLINIPATVNVTLEVGGISETVTVEATAEQVQTSSSGNLGTTVEQRTVESLPIVGTRGRNPLDLLTFVPGVTTGANTGGGVHVNGSRDRSFNFTLDGIDINESTAGGSNFTPLRPNPDSIQEFQVITSGFSAELGRSSGAQVTFVTRSGTNNFRGTLFEYYQTDKFMARSYASNVNGTAKEAFNQHIFGGSFGGPIIKDRAFFFANLQILRASDTLLSTRTVYTQQARQGIFRWVQGGVNGTGSVDANGNPTLPICNAAYPAVPTNTPCINSYNVATGSGISLDPLMIGYLNNMPLPNSFSATGDGLNIAGYLFNALQIEKQYDFVTKFDYKINDENSVYVRWANGEQNTFGDAANSGRPRYPNGPNFVDTYRKPKNLAVNWRWSPTSRFTNEFLAGWSKFFFKFITGPEGDPNYNFAFNLPTDSNFTNTYNARGFRTFQFVDNMTFDFSPHVIKAGANFRLGRSSDDRSSVAGGLIELNYNLSRTVNSNFNFPTPLPTGTAINSADRTRMENMINDVLGRVGTISQAFVNDPNNPDQFGAANTRWLFRADHPELDFYVQDTWRVTPNLIFDLGLRWEMRFAPSAVGGRPILVPDKPFVLGSAPANNLRWTEGSLFDDEYGLLLPTLGLAWDPLGDGKTSIRANYRKASDRIATFLYSSFIFQSAPGNTFLGTNTAFGQAGGLRRQGLPSVAPTGSPDQLRTPPAFSTGSTTVIDPDLKFPAIHNWSLSFQRELFWDNVFEFNYIGKKATNLFGGYNVNQADIYGRIAGAGGSFLEEFNLIRANASYNSPLMNLLLAGSTANNAGTALFRTLNATALTQGSVATLALAASQRLCGSADVTAGRCTNANLNQQLIGVHGRPNFFQPFTQFTGGLFVVDSNDFSFYNGLEFILRRRMRSGLSFQLGYTWALSKDTRSFDPVFTSVGTGNSGTAANTAQNPYDRRANYAWSDFDRRHSLLGTYVWEVPVGRGRWMGSDMNRVLDYIVGGWQIAGTVRLTSGRPFSVLSSLNTVSSSVTSYGNCNNCPRDLGSLVQGNFENTSNPNLRNWWFNNEARALFTLPNPGEVGNTGRNYFIGPGYFETDMSLSKKFRITERISFDLRGDFKNLLNSVNFAAPTATLPAGLAQSGFGTSIFGRINADTSNNARRVQVSGRLNF
jgi:hypothetical protein